MTPKFREWREESEVRNQRSQQQEFGRRGIRHRENGWSWGNGASGNADGGGIVSAKEGIRGDDAMGADKNWRG